MIYVVLPHNTVQSCYMHRCVHCSKNNFFFFFFLVWARVGFMISLLRGSNILHKKLETWFYKHISVINSNIYCSKSSIVCIVLQNTTKLYQKLSRYVSANRGNPQEKNLKTLEGREAFTLFSLL